ncbi:DUF3159 domain-containing protein [Mycobacterium sp. TNTM28]|uniref:DUF3159 domain-containing protein n=1 Tax=[Mycobacterium] fortunisiensis TaxID=2600579 RepID=A0ABS6KFH6_9MYCO|nr:DUF3159 domain-containing protein [[Mycobacterium] fortunisiensis]MBU9762315.1 DUF3159 domain-containing protein [[Mycobacterium] fortunisiensis]
MTSTPVETALARVGGIRGLVYSALPVTTFAVVSAASGRIPATAAAVGVAAVILVWQLVRRESTRPALWGFAGVALCAGVALVTGQAKDFYLPGIWMYLGLGLLFTASILVGRPVVGVFWAWVTGRDSTWRGVARVRLAFTAATAVMAAVSWVRFVVQYYLYDTDQDGLLAAARIAMGWPLMAITLPAVLLAVRYAVRALPVQTLSSTAAGDQPVFGE